ncbi:hypothetical protein QAO71_03275 [Halopseudomonas sp. SMJS2]|nr:hypothetical protein [Halopseudomonas sp. SMJS2]WGK63217.1 hypothetical protein QAO71_03275 [Halopseudomonas sp. SMJS2]
MRFHGMHHPLELGTSDVNAFLRWQLRRKIWL